MKKRFAGKQILTCSSKRQPKPLAKIKTINDLLARDEVNEVLRDLEELKPNISDLIVIYNDKRDNQFYYDITPSTLESMATWLLESTKIDMLTRADDD